MRTLLATTLLATPSIPASSTSTPTDDLSRPGKLPRSNTGEQRVVHPVRAVGVEVRYHGHTAREWALRFRIRTRQLARVNVQLHRRWAPTVTYALRLASAVSGIGYWELRSVAHCESTLNPFASNGRYLGLFQLSWTPYGFDPFDPVANALSAAMTVRHDGGWRQWECKP